MLRIIILACPLALLLIGFSLLIADNQVGASIIAGVCLGLLMFPPPGRGSPELVEEFTGGVEETYRLRIRDHIASQPDQPHTFEVTDGFLSCVQCDLLNQRRNHVK